VWVSVDFDSKYKILWGETRDHGVPIHEEKKLQKKESTSLFQNFHPLYYQTDASWGGGGDFSVYPSRL